MHGIKHNMPPIIGFYPLMPPGWLPNMQDVYPRTLCYSEPQNVSINYCFTLSPWSVYMAQLRMCLDIAAHTDISG